MQAMSNSRAPETAGFMHHPRKVMQGFPVDQAAVAASRFNSGEAQRLPFRQPGFRHLASQVADATDGGRALRDRNHTASLQQVEGVAALEHEVQRRCRQILLDQIRCFSFINGEELFETLRIRRLEIEMALPFLKRQPDVAVLAVAFQLRSQMLSTSWRYIARRSRP